jgi:hypothetical protein
MRKIILLTLVVFLFIFGCIKNVSGPSKYGEDYVSKLDKYAIYDPAIIEECKLGECKCFSCKNETSFFGFTKSLVGGSCRFISNCTNDKFYSLMNQSDTAYVDEGPWQFMIGQGYSFSDFGDANPWCGNRLDMAVHWLVGTNDTPYPDADADRAMCMLDKGIIPVYVLYSDSKNVDPTATYSIASTLGKGGKLGNPVGPVIITTEIDFNSSDPEVVDNVTKQIDNINSACDNSRPGTDPENWKINCMVALAPKMGDYEAVKTILEDRGYKDKVDLIAFGVNAHTVNLSATRKSICDADDVWTQALAFAKFSLYNYSKPTVIPYVMFDAKGTDLSGKCTWLEKDFIDGYSSFFPLQLPHLKKAGVIGVAPYDFNSTTYNPTNPLNCQDCALGTSEARLAAWYASCKSYKTLEGKYNTGNIFLRFANESGGYCDFGVDYATILQRQFGDTFNYKVPALTDPEKTYFRCDACVNENLTFPFKVPIQKIITSEQANKTYCESVPAIEFYSSKRNLDPYLVRALIVRESTFEACAIGLIKGECDNGRRGFDYLPDPEGVCTKGNTQLTDPTTRYCGIGMMQTLIPPYTFWPSPYYPGLPGTPASEGEDGEWYEKEGYYVYKDALAAGRSQFSAIPFVKAECSPYFNPFNATHSVCYGTYHFKGNLDTATSIVANNKAELEATDSNKERILSYYIALNYYRGYGTWVDDWINAFALNKKYTPAYCALQEHSEEPQCVEAKSKPFCYGQTDFIYYVNKCWFGTLGKPKKGTDKDYAFGILAMYQDLVNSCAQATCPSWKRLAAACKTPPSSWPPLPGEKCDLIED